MPVFGSFTSCPKREFAAHGNLSLLARTATVQCYVRPQAFGGKDKGVPGFGPFEAGPRRQKENENGRSTALRLPLSGKGQVEKSAGSCLQGQLCRWHATVDSGTGSRPVAGCVSRPAWVGCGLRLFWPHKGWEGWISPVLSNKQGLRTAGVSDVLKEILGNIDVLRHILDTFWAASETLLSVFLIRLKSYILNSYK